jgi:putative endonuclease
MNSRKQPAVYILSSKRNGTIYIGVTSDLVKRIYEHKNKLVHGFSYTYAVRRLVYYELHESMESAIHREKCLKKWNRVWKLNLIEGMNPEWRDLYDEII